MRLTKEEREEIIKMYRTGGYAVREIAEWIGCCNSTVVRTIRGEKSFEKTKTNCNRL